MLAEESKSNREKAAGVVFTTAVAPLTGFTLAEFYHQKYFLQADKFLMSEFLNVHSSEEEIVNSTIAARLNGYVSGYGTAEELEAELSSYGLSEKGATYLRDSIGSSDP